MNLFNANSLDILTDIPDNSIDLIVTDPPYRTTARGSYGDTGGILKDELNMKGKVFFHNDIKITDWIGALYRVLKEGGHCYIMTNNVNLCEYLTEIKKAGFNIFKTLVWKKDNCITNMYYMDNHEYIIFCRKGKAMKIKNCGTKSVLEIPNPKNKSHPTEKPVGLMEILIENSSKEGDTVLDPFMGSGSTGVACVNTGRNFIGIELDEQYFKIAQDRINKTKSAWLDDLLGGVECK